MYSLADLLTMYPEEPDDGQGLATLDEAIPADTTLRAEKQMFRRQVDIARSMDGVLMQLLKARGMAQTRSPEIEAEYHGR